MAFNVVILLTGAATLFVIEMIASLMARFGGAIVQPTGDWSFVVLYLLAINICYTLGWVSELLWSDGDTARTELLRPAVYRWGLTFSVAITLLPAVLVPLFWFVQGVHSAL